MGKPRRQSESTAMKRSGSRRAAPEAERQTKKQIAFGRKQARQNRIIWLAVAVVAALIVAIVAFGLIREVVIGPGTAVATVNGEKVRLDDYQALLRLYRFNLHQGMDELTYNLQLLDPSDPANEQLISLLQSQMSLYESDLATIPETTLDQLIEDQLISQKADELGVSIPSAEVDRTINESLTPASQTPTITETDTIQTPTPIPQRQLDADYRTLLDTVGISNRKYRAIVERGLLRAALQDRLAGDLPVTGLIAHVQHIQLATAEEATAAMARLEAGEDFAVLARDLSTDPGADESGGDLAWVAVGEKAVTYGDAWDSLVFELQPGEQRQVQSEELFYIVRVLDREEDGALPEAALLQRQNTALSDWLEERLVAPDVAIVRLLEPGQIPEDPFAER